jgi:hypothetical protein
VSKVHNKPIKRQRKGSNKESKSQLKGTLVWRIGLSGESPDSVGAHRTVWCASGATATSRATVVCNRIQYATVRARVRARAVAYRTVYRTCPVHHRTAQRIHKSELQRSNPNGLLTWLAHRTVSGGAPDCPVRQATAHFQCPVAHRTVPCAMRQHTSNGHFWWLGL